MASPPASPGLLLVDLFLDFSYFLVTYFNLVLFSLTGVELPPFSDHFLQRVELPRNVRRRDCRVVDEKLLFERLADGFRRRFDAPPLPQRVDIRFVSVSPQPISIFELTNGFSFDVNTW